MCVHWRHVPTPPRSHQIPDFLFKTPNPVVRETENRELELVAAYLCRGVIMKCLAFLFFFLFSDRHSPLRLSESR